VVIKGPVTGSDYRFSGVQRLQLVDPRDAVTMARHPLLRVEAVVEIGATAVLHKNGGRGNA